VLPNIKGKGEVTPLQARLWPRGGRGIALLFQDLDARRGWVVRSTHRPQFTPGENPCTHCKEGWVGPKAGLVTEHKSNELLRKLQIHKGKKLKHLNTEIRGKSIHSAGDTIYESESKFLFWTLCVCWATFHISRYMPANTSVKVSIN